MEKYSYEVHAYLGTILCCALDPIWYFLGQHQAKVSDRVQRISNTNIYA